MNKIGVMQGRLTAPRGRGLQFFPFENWENEFFLASQMGLSEIEFIFDLDRYDQNPLWTVSGTKAILRVIEQTGVHVNSICFDYFMREPFYKESALTEQKAIRERNRSFLLRVLDAAASIGVRLIEIPLVDNSSLSGDTEKLKFEEFVKDILRESEPSIMIGLETDLNPRDFLEFMRGFDHPGIRANYDTGNSSGIGYLPREEIEAYGCYIENIHIKDRLLNGSTVPLGTGHADFGSFFETLGETGYAGSFILQAARGADGREVEAVSQQMDFVQRYIARYLGKTRGEAGSS